MGKTRKDRRDHDREYREYGGKNRTPKRRNKQRESFNEFKNATVDDVLKDFDPVGGDN